VEDAAGRMSNPPENTAVEGRMIPSLLLEGPEQARRQAALMVSDLLQPGLKLVFCGYNPSLGSGRSGPFSAISLHPLLANPQTRSARTRLPGV
jgi:hypothetical protein